jgi:mRNA interferase MazF
MVKGDVVLIPFPFKDLTGGKLRPAVVLIPGIVDLTVSFITTQLRWEQKTDIILQPDSETGIKKQSLIRLSKIATIDRSLAVGLLGNLNVKLINELDRKLKLLFQLT